MSSIRTVFELISVTQTSLVTSLQNHTKIFKKKYINNLLDQKSTPILSKPVNFDNLPPPRKWSAHGVIEYETQ